MPIDASIYSNVQTPVVNVPSPLDIAEKATKLSALGIQNAQMKYQLNNTNAVRGAYAKYTDPNTGQLNREGFLSELGKSAPMAASDYMNQFNKQDKEQGEAKEAQMKAAHGIASITNPATGYLLSLDDQEATRVLPNVIKQLKAQGVPDSAFQGIPMAGGNPAWDRGYYKQAYAIGSQYKEQLENQLIQSNIGKAALEKQKLEFGSSGANAELSSQYEKQVEAIRKSQIAMQQMIDNYHNPSPQGYASLKLNAFKIKFPNAPDVNSLEELSNAQGVTDKMRAWANQNSSGMDQTTTENLMRDGVSTYRANVNTLRGIQKKMQARQQFQNVNDPTLTYEPAIDDTYGQAMNIQNKIGPYVPPAERGGVTGAALGLMSKLTGAGPATANASTKAPPPPPPGMIRMMDPSGNTRLIPASQKAEAIAAGGSVVKNGRF